MGFLLDHDHISVVTLMFFSLCDGLNSQHDVRVFRHGGRRRWVTVVVEAKRTSNL